jgi:hypothetical protein
MPVEFYKVVENFGGTSTGFVETLLTYAARSWIYLAWKPLDR